MMARSWTLGAVLLASGVAGCGGRGSSSPADDASWTRTLLARLRDAHGGAERWRARAGVSFSYVAEADGSELAIREVGFRPADYRYLWVSDGGAPVRLDLSAPPGALLRAALDAGASLRRPEPGIEAPVLPEDADRKLEFALRAIRYLFQLPLATVTGRWEFRSFVPPGTIDLPPALELDPLEPSSPIAACLVHAWEGRPIRHAIVVPSDRAVPFRVLFDDLRDVDGHPVAATRCHVPAVEGLDSPSRDPFGLVSAEVATGAGCRLRERVGDVRFLGPEEARTRYPVPEDAEPAAPPPPSSAPPPAPR